MIINPQLQFGTLARNTTIRDSTQMPNLKYNLDGLGWWAVNTSHPVWADDAFMTLQPYNYLESSQMLLQYFQPIKMFLMLVLDSFQHLYWLQNGEFILIVQSDILLPVNIRKILQIQLPSTIESTCTFNNLVWKVNFKMAFIMVITKSSFFC